MGPYIERAEKQLILGGLCVQLCDLRKTFAMVVLTMRGRPQIIRGDPNAAVVTPNRLGICSSWGFYLRSSHVSDSSFEARFIGMRDIVRRTTARSGPI